MQRLGECTSPVVDRTFNKRQSILTSKSARLWALINFVFALMMFYELSFGPISSYFGVQHIIVWYLVCVLAAIFTINTIIDFCKFVAPSFSSAAVELTPNQKRLLGVRDSDLGFKLATPSVLSTSASPTSTIISPSSFSSHSISGQSTPYSPTQGIVTLGYSPILTSRFSPNQRTPSPTSRTPSPHHHYDSSGSYIANSSHISSSGSFLQGQGSSSTLNQSSLGASFNRSAVSPLSNTATLSPLFRENLDASLRFRPGRGSMKNSPSECITDLNTLSSFLKEEQEKEMRSYLGSPENNPGNTSSFWNFGRTITDYTPVLKKYQYQIACRSPQSTKSPSADPDDPSTFRAEQVWAKVGIHVSEVDIWIENLRKWLGQTIMTRLVIEIKNINRQLARTGSEDMQIGEVSISTLKSLAVTKSQLLPSLNTVIPFLEIGSNQEYLVQRIFQLGTGGCMHEFRWNGGGEYKGKPWSDHLPTDAAIVMHCFCTYMDSRLPPHPKYPDGKTFTSQYYLKTPDKPDFKKKDNLLIYHFKINPPHYKAIIEDDTWDLPKGRNNMFQAILLFLHHIIVKHHGMLGRVNLGLSGINILWVLESNKMDDSDGSQRVKY